MQEAAEVIVEEEDSVGEESTGALLIMQWLDWLFRKLYLSIYPFYRITVERDDLLRALM